MPVYLLGESGAGGATFDRAFFSTSLESLLEKGGPRESVRVTLYLSDGITLDVCTIEELRERYVVLRAFRTEEEACDIRVHVVPYPLIYRIEIGPRDSDSRVGFTWVPRAENGAGPEGRAAARKKGR